MAPIPFAEFKWEGKELCQDSQIPPSLKQCGSDAQRTAYVVNFLRQSTSNDARKVMDTQKQIWEQGQKVNTKFDLARGERERATAWYLFERKTNNEACQQCQARNSKGPFIECVASSDNIATGACLNCYYSGTSVSCSIRQESEQKKRATSTFSKLKPEGFTKDGVERATWRQLDQWENQITAEQLARDGNKAQSMAAAFMPKKRGHQD
ncbi:hypothetical protein F4860DRAFT_429317 [Xylaria cubensis]|nr:hypothetical protein F4860DRAFT_429317 [Xylaria cubensis]